MANRMIRPLLLVLLCCGLLSGTLARAEEDLTRAGLDALMADTLTHISDYSLAPVTPQALALSGLSTLMGADPGFRIHLGSHKLSLSYRSRPFRVVRTPEETDITAWSHLLARAVRDTDRLSTPLRDLGQTGRIKRLIDGMLAPMGNYSRYLAPADASQRRHRRAGDLQLAPACCTARMVDGAPIALIHIREFNRNTAQTVAGLLGALRADSPEPLRGLLLDLRGNTGGLLSEAVKVANLFLDRGLITRTQGRHPFSTRWYFADPGDIANGLPMAVLVDGGTASAAEITAAALTDPGLADSGPDGRSRALLVGTHTFGKATVQSVYRLQNGGELLVTWSQYLTPSGGRIHGEGLMPALCTFPVVSPRAICPAVPRNTDPEDVRLASTALLRAGPAPHRIWQEQEASGPADP